jgi:hypothetical protein
VFALVLEDVLGVWLVEVLHGVGVCVHLVIILLMVIVFLHVVAFLLFLQFIVLQKNELVVEKREEPTWVEGSPSGVNKVVDSIPATPLAIGLPVFSAL